MSILNGIFSLGYILGVQLGSRIESYILVFSLATVLGFLGVFYSIFILRESLKKKVSYIYMWIKRLQIETGLLQIETSLLQIETSLLQIDTEFPSVSICGRLNLDLQQAKSRFVAGRSRFVALPENNKSGAKRHF